MSSAQWLVAVLVIAVFVNFGIPTIFSILREYDYKMQISGRKPTRAFIGNVNIYKEKDLLNQATETIKVEEKLNTARGIIGIAK